MDSQQHDVSKELLSPSKLSEKEATRPQCGTRFSKRDHETLISNILKRLGSKGCTVLKKLIQQPELLDEDWEVDKVLNVTIVDDVEWCYFKWVDWPEAFACWDKRNIQELDSHIIEEYNTRKALFLKDSADGNISDVMPVDNRKRTSFTPEELSGMARSLAKHMTWPTFIAAMQRLDNEFNYGIFDKDEAILNDIKMLHISVPIGLKGAAQIYGKALIARKRLECQLSELENVYVEIVNSIDDEAVPSLPPDFDYITENMFTANDIAPAVLESLVGCACKACIPGTRKCCSRQAGVAFAYRDDVPNTLIDYQRSQAIYECNSLCKCSFDNCTNRVLQKGLTIPMQLFKTEGRGWGLRTLKPIKCGQFVIEYVGEVITTAEADERKGNSYLFDLDFNPEGEGRYTIDAMTYGNLSRFINSRCNDANLSTLAVYVDCVHPDLPRIGFFANRDIEPLEELTFDYLLQGDADSLGFTCLCGSSRCRGTMKLSSPRFETEEEEKTLPQSSRQTKRPRRGGGRGRRGRKGFPPQEKETVELNGNGDSTLAQAAIDPSKEADNVVDELETAAAEQKVYSEVEDNCKGRDNEAMAFDTPSTEIWEPAVESLNQSPLKVRPTSPLTEQKQEPQSSSCILVEGDPLPSKISQGLHMMSDSIVISDDETAMEL